MLFLLVNDLVTALATIPQGTNLAYIAICTRLGRSALSVVLDLIPQIWKDRAD